MCYFKNLHNGHKLVELSDEEALKKENITIDFDIETKITIIFLIK